MKSKHLLLTLLMALVVPWAASAQETVTVNDGTTTNGNVPVYGFYADAYNKCEFVQPAADLADMNGATINGVTFYASQSSVSWGSANFQVFLTEVGSTSISAFNGPGTVVYEGALSISGGTMTVNFSTPYTYNGGNLLVGVYQTAIGGYSSTSWYGVSATGASGSGFSYSSLSSCSFSQKNFLPKMTFVYEPASTGCDMPTSIAVSDITPDGATVAWEGEGSAWNLRYKASTDADFTLVEGLTAQTYSLDRLASNTSYSVGVQTVCGSSTSSFKSTTFTTANPCAAPTNLQVTNITAESATLTWTPGYQETEWTVKYKKSTETEYTSTTVSRQPSINLTGLDGCTQYNVQIYNCESCLSGNFVTAAGIPFTESFATTSAPAGWTRYSGLLSAVMSGTALTTTTSGWNFYTGNGVFDNHARVNIYGSSCQYWLVAPTLTMENNVQLTFDLALTKYSGTLQPVDPTQQTDDKFVVLITTNGGATWEILRQWDNESSNYVYNEIACSAVGETVAIDLSSYAGQDIAVAFYGESTESGGDNNLHIDNVSIDYIPDCAKPTGLAKANVTAHTVDLSWTSDAEAWVVAYKAANDAEFTEVNVTENPYTLTGLLPETAYTAKVKADCGGVYSEYTNTISFTTGIACTAPTGVAVSNITGHGVTITWNAEEGALFEYSLVQGENPEPSYSQTELNTLTWTNLTPETATTFFLRKNCGELDGYSQVVTRTFTTDVACPAPTGLAAALTPGNGSIATLSWTNDANAWVVAYKTAEEEEFTEVNVDENPYMLTGLTPETAYTAKVKAVCGGEDGESDWSSSITFTPTNAYMLTVNDGTTTNDYVPVYGYYVDNYSYSQFIIPATNLTAMEWGTINELTFYSSSATAAWTGAKFEVYMTETTETTLSALADWTTMDKVMNEAHLEISGNQMVVTLDAPYQYLGGNLMVGIKQTVSGTYSCAYFYGITATGASMGGYGSSYGSSISQKNFLPKTTFAYEPGEAPACPKPTGLAVNYAGGLTATVTWEGDATSYNIDVNGTVTEGVTSPYTLEGLELATTYAVMVQANCGEDLSEWTSAVSFTTDLCMPENQCEITFELTDSYGDGWNGAYIEVVDVTTETVLGQFTNTSEAEGGEAQIYTLAVCNGRAIQFVWHSGSYDSECSYVVTDINDEVIFSGSGAMSAPVNYTVDCTVPACPKPTGLAVNYAGGLTATVTWEGDATSYNIDVNGTVTEGVTSPYTLEGLELATTYNVMVQAVCSAEELSEWTAPVSFTTDLCMPENQCQITITLTDAYGDGGGEIVVIDNATEEVLGTYTNLGASTTYTLNVCEGRELSFVFNSTDDWSYENGWVITDVNDEIISEHEGCPGSCEAPTEGVIATYTVNCTVITCKKPKDLAAFDINKKSVVLSWTPGSEDQNAWRICYNDGEEDHFKNVTTIPYTLNGLTPETTYTVKVRANCGGGDYSDWSDEISFTTAEACPAVIDGFSASNITVHNAQLNWNGDYNSYQVHYKKLTGETEWSEAIPTNEAAIALSRLEAGTVYVYQVRGYCSDVDVYSEWVDGDSFETQSIFDAPQNLYAVPGIDNATISWTGYQERYRVTFGETSETVVGTTYTITGLTSSTDYTVTVTGVGTECGEYQSATLEFTTGAGWDDPTIWDPENPETINPNTVVVIEPGENPTEIPENITVGDGSYIVIEPGAEVIYGGEAPIPVVLGFDDDDDDGDGMGPRCRENELPGGYRLIAPPVFNSAEERFVTVVSTHLMDLPDDYFANDLYRFDQNCPQAEWRNYKEVANSFVNFDWKQGYLYYGDYTKVNWQGHIVANTNNSVEIALGYNEANTYLAGLNLIGNPFWAKGYPNMNFYVLNTAGNEVVAATNNYVCKAKGFFVLATEQLQSCTVYTEAPDALQSLNIALSQDCSLIDAAAIRFNDTKDLAKIQLNPNHTKIYMPFEGKDYAILQGEGLGEMPINFEAEENGTYTLSFTSKEVNFSYLHLIDNLTGVETNLLANPSYSFEAKTTDYASRFRLVYATGSSVNGDNFGFINSMGNLSIYGIEGVATLQVMDVTGRILSTETFSGSYERKLNVAPGVYMLRLINGNDVKVQKMILK